MEDKLQLDMFVAQSFGFLQAIIIPSIIYWVGPGGGWMKNGTI
jgi:hypothetical protein